MCLLLYPLKTECFDSLRESNANRHAAVVFMSRCVLGTLGEP